MKDRICLLITVFNRTPQLVNSLRRLTYLTLPYEILIVDDGSEPGLEQELKQFEEVLPIRYIYNNNKDWSICSMARNIGIKNTDCEIVITSEPEILFLTDNIKEMLSLHYENPNQVINVGTIYHQGKDGVTDERTIREGWIDMSMVNESGHNTNPVNPKGHAKIKNWVAPFCALYRKEWLMKIDGWNEEFTGAWGWDDTLLLTRLTWIGVNQLTDTNLEAVHQWHEKLPPHIQFKSSQDNERMFKEFVEKRQIKANVGKEWGVIQTR